MDGAEVGGVGGELGEEVADFEEEVDVPLHVEG